MFGIAIQSCVRPIFTHKYTELLYSAGTPSFSHVPALTLTTPSPPLTMTIIMIVVMVVIDGIDNCFDLLL